MSEAHSKEANVTSRRDFIKTSGRIAAVSALAGVVIPHVHASDSQTINVALVGCGGRGSGAVDQALSVKEGNTKLVAMADVFEGRLKNSYTSLKRQHPMTVSVPDDHKFIGLDGYKHAIDCLRPGDIAVFTTPPAFRWVHFMYAIEKGVNVFMEKPVTVDGPTSRRMLKLAEEADKKNLKVGVGLMVRHCRARHELLKRIQDGEIGDITMMRAYRMHGPAASAFSDPKPDTISELMYQIQRFHSFLWASGGLFSDFYIHQIDECCWMKGAWPVKAQALGGRHYRGAKIDQNFDIYAVEYTFADGTRFFLNGRTINGCKDDMSSNVHGTKGLGIVSSAGHTPGNCRTFKGHNIKSDAMLWRAKQPEANPYQLEWDDLVDAIRKDKRYNEVKRGVEASLVTSMGRMAAHTGQEITFEEMLNCGHEFAPGLDRLTSKSQAPLQPDRKGKYPVPQPGKVTRKEYET
jgi:predicted dehydrogenase